MPPTERPRAAASAAQQRRRMFDWIADIPTSMPRPRQMV
jgi:hypothetical protein